MKSLFRFFDSKCVWQGSGYFPVSAIENQNVNNK